MKISNPQMRYYRGVCVKEQLDHYEQNPDNLLIDVVKALKVSLTEDFIHELNKMMYNNGQSTTKLMRLEKDAKGDSIAFNNFLDRIRHRHLHTHQHLIALPNEIPIGDNYGR